MGRIYTTEITSDQLPSDNPLHQRLYKAYVVAKDYCQGDVLEIGCGEGRGIDLLMEPAQSFTAVDKIDSVLKRLRERYPSGKFIRMDLPPLTGLASDSFDVVVSFQVIEHIKKDIFFLEEIYRVLKPGGTALLTTPNRKLSLSRNPWHIREYLAHELHGIASGIFSQATINGIAGNEKVMIYYEQNRRSVQRIMRWDILRLQHRLPAWMLRVPYEMLNRRNRNKLRHQDQSLVAGITHHDYFVTDDADNALDLFLIVKK